MRPTPEQFDAAHAMAEREGIGIERALLLTQADQIGEVQQARWLQSALGPELIVTMQATIEGFVAALADLAASPSWAVLVGLTRDAAKREQRRKRHARWQARR